MSVDCGDGRDSAGAGLATIVTGCEGVGFPYSTVGLRLTDPERPAVHVGCPGDNLDRKRARCHTRLVVRAGGQVVAHARVVLPKATSTTVALPLDAAARRHLERNGSLTVRLRVRIATSYRHVVGATFILRALP